MFLGLSLGEEDGPIKEQLKARKIRKVGRASHGERDQGDQGLVKIWKQVGLRL